MSFCITSFDFGSWSYHRNYTNKSTKFYIIKFYMRNSEISLITLRFISPISDFYGIMNIQKYHLQFASNHYPFGSICRTRKTHKYVFYVRQCCIVLYADGFPHVPITTHQPNVYNSNIIPSILIYPAHSNTHSDILIILLYVYE